MDNQSAHHMAAHEAKAAASILVDTWGHKEPSFGEEIPGWIVVAIGVRDCSFSVLEDCFIDKTGKEVDGPLWFKEISDFTNTALKEQSINGYAIFRFEGTYIRQELDDEDGYLDDSKHYEFKGEWKNITP